MHIDRVPDAAALAKRAADHIARILTEAVADRGRGVLAFSGGSTPWKAFAELAQRDLPWSQLHLLQVDERIAPAGHADRNLEGLRNSLGARFDEVQLHPMPVEDADLDAATEHYTATLRELCGDAPAIDLVQLGLGSDGHTASLIPGDAVLEATGEVALTELYAGRRRMTLTFEAINRARQILWLVAGESKAPMVGRLLRADPTIPGGRIAQTQATLLADEAALRSAPT